jgi:hypothetical protein
MESVVPPAPATAPPPATAPTPEPYAPVVITEPPVATVAPPPAVAPPRSASVTPPRPASAAPPRPAPAERDLPILEKIRRDWDEVKTHARRGGDEWREGWDQIKRLFR